MTDKDKQLLDCADERGIIKTEGGQVREDCRRLVKAGLLVQLSYFVFSLPEGGRARNQGHERRSDEYL